MENERPETLRGLTILSFESRHAREMAELIRRYGGEPVIAPSMREIPLDQNRAALDFVSELEAGKIDVVLFLTGVGIRTLVDAVAAEYPKERLAAALRRTVLVARGPKPIAALKELGLESQIRVPEPNTWRELLSELDAKLPVRGKRVAVQEYGLTNTELLDGLKTRGAEIVRVPVYRWDLPKDTAPLRTAIQQLIEGKVEMALFTNAMQVVHLFRLAEEEKLEENLRRSLDRVVVASIGPICSEALDHFGLKADLEPEHPKMGHFIAAVARRGRQLLEEKKIKRA